ncbi:DNA mismatch endonuclease Vsr [Streptomyces sp. NPDC008240]|uniref:very short patch repair endonuclease n=1 Tax=Streptomyces sp. NPDC008240 TaxID=3364822 RepID=UPI0036F05037
MSAGVDPVVSARMSRIRGRDTAPEIKVRRELHRRGLRYRVNFKPVSTLKRTVDIAFTRQRVAVLIDGCFWHGCPEHFRPAKGDRREFWAAKIAENQRRDQDSTRAFTLAGWTVLRFWEHADPVEVADKVEDEVIKRSVSRRSPSERPCR